MELGPGETVRVGTSETGAELDLTMSAASSSIGPSSALEPVVAALASFILVCTGEDGRGVGVVVLGPLTSGLAVAITTVASLPSRP
jgi:hypothetical protein